MVGSALAQEGVSGVSSYISSKLEEKASMAHTVARLEMALSQLEFALERARKLPITYVSLLRRMKMLERAHLQGTDLLNKHKKMVEEEDQDAARRRIPFLDGIFRRAASLSLLPISSSLIGPRKTEECLTSSIAQRFEWYAACADKFVADVESGCPLRHGDHHAFRYPLLRHLLEGKTLCYEKVRGRREQQHYSLHVWPVRLQERGVEARLLYQYLDRERPEKRFRVRLVLRISEDTDIIGMAIKCLRSLTSQFKLATASAVGELTVLPHLQDIAQSYGPPLDWTEETYVGLAKSWRPDPICCAGESVAFHHGGVRVPEPVIALGFACYISAPEYSKMLDGSSSSSSGNDAVVVEGRNAPPPLFLVASFVPHHMCAGGAPRGIVLSYGSSEECLGGDSIHQVMCSDPRRSSIASLARRSRRTMLYLTTLHMALRMLQCARRATNWNGRKQEETVTTLSRGSGAVAGRI